jgi:hypothetical protein
MVRNALAEKGVAPIVEYWADPGTRTEGMRGNWFSVVVSGGGIGALSLLGEHPEAERWVALSKKAMLEWIDDNIPADGGYCEGLTYFEYALSNLLPFAKALQRVTGDGELMDALAGRKLSCFPLYCGYLAEKTTLWVNFGDCDTRMMHPSVYGGLANLFKNGYLQWFTDELLKPGCQNGMYYDAAAHNFHYFVTIYGSWFRTSMK